MHDVGSKLLNRINVNSLACVRVKEGEIEYFKMNSDSRQGCIMSPCILNVYMDTLMKMKMGMVRRGVRFQEEGRE